MFGDSGTIGNWLTELLYVLPGIVLGLALHEYSHALVAYKCGDETQRSLGRLTLNPIKHIDPMGFLFIVLFKFGWAKPVQINGKNLKKPKRDYLLISIAGPLSNLLLGILMSLIYGILTVVFLLNESLIDNTVIYAAISVFYWAMIMNLFLFIFNMLPIPSFDGYHALTSFLPARIMEKLYPLEKFGILIFFLLVIFDVGLGFITNWLNIISDFFIGIWSNVIMFFIKLF